uniref:Uncharacterized protein n=2 Tax=Spongospora subterranea TaxID=70186 RepID=A0A0H5QY92_9EUKA|eukprot:CRZ06895.1 hypothetical protein [Spongospora subterranea]
MDAESWLDMFVRLCDLTDPNETPMTPQQKLHALLKNLKGSSLALALAGPHADYVCIMYRQREMYTRHDLTGNSLDSFNELRQRRGSPWRISNSCWLMRKSGARAEPSSGGCGNGRTQTHMASSPMWNFMAQANCPAGKVFAIRMTIGDRPLLALVDSGASLNFMDKDVLPAGHEIHRLGLMLI